MIKFLLSLPLAIFIGVAVIVIYNLGDLIFTAAREGAAIGLIGDWDFWQIVLAMSLITIGMILAAFLYVLVVLKPAFYPPPEKPRRNPQRYIENHDGRLPHTAAETAARVTPHMAGSARPVPYYNMAVAGTGARHMPNAVRSAYNVEEDAEPGSKKKLLIILISVFVLIAALVTAGFIFREPIFDFIDDGLGRFAFVASILDRFRDEEDAPGIIGADEEHSEPPGEQEPEPEQQPEPEDAVAAVSYFNDVQPQFNWTLFYPPELTFAYQPIDTGAYRNPSDTDTQLLYWPELNEAGHAGAEAFAAAESGGLLEGAIEHQVLNENVVIARFEGEGYFTVRFWHIEIDAIASVEIALETEARAVEWYAAIGDGAIYIVRNAPVIMEIDEPEETEWIET